MKENFMDRMQKIKAKIDSLPKGSISKSGRYWCVTCKKFFRLNEPVCPYMPGMCVNTPIAVENIPPESTEALEKFGLFYPKLPQKILNYIIEQDFIQIGRKLAEAYLDFLEEWNFRSIDKQGLQTVKSFIIILSGCETAQRINGESVTFVLMDAEKIWEKNKIKELLTGALEFLKSKLNLKHRLAIDFIEIFGEREIGKYYCAKCGMFFEFGIKREMVTCPLMPQKCMFDPQHIDNVQYDSEKFVKQFEITPDIYRKLIRSVGYSRDFTEKIREFLEEWKIFDDTDKILQTFL